MLVIDSILKTNPWTYEIRGLTGEKVIENFNEKKNYC